jgi:chromosome partitioning protein
MRSILVLNPKGGCGKSTLAMNIAGYFASQGRKVALADCDPQGSSRDWLKARPASAPEIHSGTVTAGRLEVPRGMDYVVVDTPAGLHGQRLANFVKAAQTMVIPMLPSPVDIRAAERFIEELFSLRKLINRRIKLATVANRVREDTLAAAKLEHYLQRMKLPTGQQLPFLTVLRQSQNYVHAADRGLSIFEFAPARTVYDQEQWDPLVRWLSSVRSVPH